MSATTTTAALDIRPLTVNIGAEIHGLDLSQPLTAEQIAAIRQASLDHFVIFFPGQQLTPGEHVAFAGQLGELTRGSPLYPGLAAEGYPEVAPQGRSPDGAGIWHTDATFLEVPPGAGVFHAVDVPEYGGDTEFAATAVAYDSLSEPLRELVDGLFATHDWSHLNDALADRPGHWDGEPLTQVGPVDHPIVRTHPATGRNSLYLSANRTTGIPGLPEHAGRALLEYLYEHITRPEHVVRYHWRPGTVAIWDNRTVLHRAIYDLAPDVRRIVHRVNLKGERPVGPATALAGTGS